ncbi:MAG: hypothetical protein H6667_24720 [Ardenticatenaceae bacterium]|nr:hypothetical protein [Ardenticatenaceae bacterium]
MANSSGSMSSQSSQYWSGSGSGLTAGSWCTGWGKTAVSAAASSHRFLPDGWITGQQF